MSKIQTCSMKSLSVLLILDILATSIRTGKKNLFVRGKGAQYFKIYLTNTVS